MGHQVVDQKAIGPLKVADINVKENCAPTVTAPRLTPVLQSSQQGDIEAKEVLQHQICQQAGQTAEHTAEAAHSALQVRQHGQLRYSSNERLPSGQEHEAGLLHGIQRPYKVLNYELGRGPLHAET